MKKKIVYVMLALMTAVCMIACSTSTPAESEGGSEIVLDDVFNESDADTSNEEESYAEGEIPEGMYRSELTGEWIPEELKNQRPIAAMVDNELYALDHYGVNSADVVYEIMNSTMNGRITRLMCIVKDWKNIEKLGSIRSARQTNFLLAAEYNAILIHDGGPFYINEYLTKDYTNNLSGGFARFSNGKSAEFTEYVTYEGYRNPTTGKSYAGLGTRIKNSGYSEEYNEHYPGEHFTFNYAGVDLSKDSKSEKAENIILPFPHNSSKLVYNPETKLYEYYEYGKAHIDPLDDNKITTFKNVFLQSTFFVQLDEHGYLIYDVINKGEGYYITEGNAIPVKWEKIGQTGVTTYTNATTGEVVEMNVGKTYIALVPSDKWSEVELNGTK